MFLAKGPHTAFIQEGLDCLGLCRAAAMAPTAVVTTATVPIGVRSSSTAAVVVVIVRNRSCDTTAAATVQHCGRSSSMAPAPSVALAGSRGALAAMDRP